MLFRSINNLGGPIPHMTLRVADKISIYGANQWRQVRGNGFVMESKMLFLLQLGILLLGANIGGIISKRLKQPAVLGQILVGANIGGIISKRLKQPAVLGQILVGIVLGMGFMEKTELINHISEIGVIFLMFIAGLETDVEELKASGASSTTIAIAGVVFPLLLVGGGAYIITGNLISSLFLGVVSTATSVSISDRKSVV